MDLTIKKMPRNWDVKHIRDVAKSAGYTHLASVHVPHLVAKRDRPGVQDLGFTGYFGIKAEDGAGAKTEGMHSQISHVARHQCGGGSVHIKGIIHLLS